MEQPSTVDLVTLGAVAFGWFLLLVPGVSRDTLGRKRAEERDTETSTPSAAHGQKFGKLLALATRVAGRALRAIGAFVSARVFLPLVVTTRDGKQVAIVQDEMGFGHAIPLSAEED